MAKWQSGAIKNGKVRGKAKIILNLLLSNPEGMIVEKIHLKTGYSPRTIYNNLTHLKKLELVKNVFPIWSLCHSSSDPLEMAKLLNRSNIGINDLSFVLRMFRMPPWWEKRGNFIIKLKEYDFKTIEWRGRPYHQIARNDFIIQCHSNSIVFIASKTYYGEDCYDCFIQASRDFLAELEYLEQRFKHKFFYEELPQVRVRSQNVMNIGDELAKKCKKEDNRIKISVDGKDRFVVDFSDPLATETISKDHAVEDMAKYTDMIKDLLTHHNPLPSEAYKMHMMLLKSVSEIGAAQINTQLQFQTLIELLKPKKLDIEPEQIEDKPSYIG